MKSRADVGSRTNRKPEPLQGSPQRILLHRIVRLPLIVRRDMQLLVPSARVEVLKNIHHGMQTLGDVSVGEERSLPHVQQVRFPVKNGRNPGGNESGRNLTQL